MLNSLDYQSVLMILGAVVGFIIWLARLEGKVTFNEKEINELRVKHESLDSKVIQQLAQVREALARIEGFLGSCTQQQNHNTTKRSQK